jgi:hydroxymethylbilane synthase
MDLLIAARTSDLARIQAYAVGEALESSNPDIKVQYHFRQSLGDINQEDPLWSMPEKGVFTQDFREGLRQGQWDMVVHSWKDLPTEAFAGTEVVATLPRADSRDLLLFKRSHWDQVMVSHRARFFSSSPRRSHNLSRFFKSHLPFALKEVEFEPVRGNILTRMTKLVQSNTVDGLIVAKAAIDRLLLSDNGEFKSNRDQIQQMLSQFYWQVLPLSQNPTAAAQGALAIEVAEGRSDLKARLQKIHCPQTWLAVTKEREELKALGGGCHQKLGVTHLLRDYGGLTIVRGQSPGGQSLDRDDFNPSPMKLKKPYVPSGPWFERRVLPEPISVPVHINAHYVARSFALPAHIQLSPEQVVWTAGVKTWQDLAQRGIWVHGTSDSLGEQEPMAIECLAPQLHWAKWTHGDGPPSSWAHKVESYQLAPKAISDDLSQYQEFFWMSGSQFLLAMEHDPQIIKARHFCGPGHTFKTICKVIDEKASGAPKPHVLPSYSYWLKLVEESGYGSQSV